MTPALQYAMIVAAVLGALGAASLLHGWWIDRSTRDAPLSEDDFYSAVVPVLTGLALIALAISVAVISYLASQLL